MKKTTLLLGLTTVVCDPNAFRRAVLVALSALTSGPPPAQAAVTEAWVDRCTMW
jgi:hypothetical protein